MKIKFIDMKIKFIDMKITCADMLRYKGNKITFSKQQVKQVVI